MNYKLTDEHKKKILKLIALGQGTRKLAKLFNVSQSSILWFMNANKKEVAMAKNRYKTMVKNIFES